MDDDIRLQTLDWNAYIDVARRAAADGIVMLRNENEALPLENGAKVSLFGRGQLFYYKSGTGSGGMVNVGRVIGIFEALEEERGIRLDSALRQVYERWELDNPPKIGHGWGTDPWSQDEMPLTDEIVANCSRRSDVAICIIARTSGEDRDNSAAEGSYLLSGTERDMLRKVRTYFRSMIVLLNVGNIIDMSWVEDISPDAVLYVWQGGMVGGLGVADVLTGRRGPSGHLTDTIARSLSDYPSDKNFGTGFEDVYQEDIYVGYRYFESVSKDRVLYPFGFGLTYTSFSISVIMDEEGEHKIGSRLSIDFKAIVKNTGHFAGRQVVQVYARCPQGDLGKPSRSLVDFRKTDILEPGEEETLYFKIPVRRFSSYDDSGVTGSSSCWVLEQGRYDLYVGDNVRDAVCVTEEAGAFAISGNWPIEQAEEALAPAKRFCRMVMREAGSDDGQDVASYIEGPDAEDIAAAVHAELGGFEQNNRVREQRHHENGPALCVSYEEAPIRSVDVMKRIREDMPTEMPYSVGNKKLQDVLERNCAMEEFIGQLTDIELAQIVRGEGMGSPLVTPGTAGAFGGVSSKLREKGIPAVCCADGPSGMRLDCGDHAFCIPVGTLLACTFDRDLNTELYTFFGMEMAKNRVDCILAPGVNIHRHPLNGRNFEYFSEDPYLAGEIASAQIAGLRKSNARGVLKHFAANNRETNRNALNSVVSERALREIYLRPFEIAVRSGGADAIMTSYGLLNGIHTSSLYDLTTTVLREEWGFDGIVMTDWWSTFSPHDIIEGMQGYVEGQCDEAALTEDMKSGRICDFSALVRAQNDLYMVVADGERLRQGENGLSGTSLGGAYSSAEEPHSKGYSSEGKHMSMYSTRNERFRGTTLDALRQGRVTRAELQRCAANICRFSMRTEAMRRLMNNSLKVRVVNAPEGEELEQKEEVKFVTVPDDGVVCDLSFMSCAEGTDSLIGFSLKPGFHYTFFFEGVCYAKSLAQVPVAFFFTSIPLATIIWNGTDGRSEVKNVRFYATTRNNVFRLHFSQNGLKLLNVRVVRTAGS